MDTPDLSLLPVLPLEDSVLFPGRTQPVSVGRPGSLAAVEAALGSESQEILVVAQRPPATDAPRSADDLYPVGTRAVIRKSLRLPNGAFQVWSHAAELGFGPRVLEESGVHCHVPAGAIPKDGPSAGITMAVALTSLVTGRAARSDTAMTGEITLTGLVLPVGGIREKVLAARRAGIRRVILPEANRDDAAELPEDVRADLELIFVRDARRVLEEALESSCPGEPLREAC